jgi:hypothetical protein
MRVVGARNIDSRQLKLLKPLNQLAATPPGLHTYNCCSNGSSSSSSAGAPRIQGPTAADFFLRYPQLHAFLLQQLQDAVEQQRQSAAAASGSSSSMDTVPPSLFPSLVLLSRLRPQLLSSSSAQAGSTDTNPPQSTLEDTTAAAAAGSAGGGMMGLDPAIFVPAVLSVGQSGVMGVRIMAAAALAPLVPAEQLQAVCLQLADTMAAAAAPTATLQQQQQQGALAGSQNGLHGTLLQLTALLSATSNSSSDQASNASSCTAAAALVQQLLPAFVQSRSVLAPHDSSSSSMCCAVRQAYVAAAGQLLVLAYKHWPLVVRVQAAPTASTPGTGSSSSSSSKEQLYCLVSTLLCSCLAAIQCTIPADTGADSSNDQQDPLYSCWLRDCTALLLGPLLQLQLLLQPRCRQAVQASSSSSNADAGVFACQVQHLALLVPVTLQSSVYDVRAAALKACSTQLQRLLSVCQQLQAVGRNPFTATAAGFHTEDSSSSSSSSSTLSALAGAVWAALQQQQQVTKVAKRLLETWGLLQQLQQLTPQGMQHVTAFGGGSEAATKASAGLPAAAATAAAAAAPQPAAACAVPPHCLDSDQLLVLSGLAVRCREPEAAAQRLLCEARVVRNVILSQPHTAAAHAGSTGTGRNGAATGCQLAAQQLKLVHGVCDTIDVYSEPRQPEQLREAAAAALQLSALLLPLVQAQGVPHAAAGHSTAAETPGPASAGSDTQQQQQQQGERDLSAPSDACVCDVSVRAWFLALRLMEDEEEDVRLAAAAAAQQALQLLPGALVEPLLLTPTTSTKSSSSSRSNTSSGGGRVQQVGAVLARAAAGAPVGRQFVAVVQYSCFAMLGRCGGWQPSVLPQLVVQLLRVVFPADTAVPQVLLRQQQAMGDAVVNQSLDTVAAARPGTGLGTAAAAAEAGAGAGAGTGARGGQSDVVLRLPGVALRRLFEREADNHHEEPLLLAQHAAVALWQALNQQQQQQQSGELCQVLQEWCSSATRGFLSGVVDSLSQAAAAGPADLQAATACADVAHPEVYVPLYRCCLGLWALGPWLHQQQQQQQQQQHSKLLGVLLGLQLPVGLHQAAQAALEGWGLHCPAMHPALFLL